MSTEGLRKASVDDLPLVQNLIERCLSLLMSKEDVAHTLVLEARIEPNFTKLVLKKLEEDNEEFFKAYNRRLMLKQQIMTFHALVNRQMEIMQMKDTIGGAVLPNSHGSPFYMSYQTPQCIEVERTGSANTIHHPVFDGVALSYPEMPGFDLHTGMHATYDTTTRIGRMDISANMPADQNPQVGIISNVSEPSYLISGSRITNDGTLWDSNTAVASPCCTSFGNSESNLPPANYPSLLNTDVSSCPWQIQGNPHLLGSDLSQGLDILQNDDDFPLSDIGVDCFPDFPDDIKADDQVAEAESKDGFPGC